MKQLNLDFTNGHVPAKHCYLCGSCYPGEYPNCPNKCTSDLPGTIMKQVIKDDPFLVGMSLPSDCRCDEVAKQMDEWGADGCEANADWIVSHLIDQATGVYSIIPQAIRAKRARHWLAVSIQKARSGALELQRRAEWGPLRLS